MMQPARLDHVADGPGTEDEFHRFFQTEYVRLSQALWLLTGSRNEAEDVAQEAMVRVYERWGRVRAMHSPIGYLFRTALNLNRSRLRHLTVRARLVFAGEASVDPAGVVEARDAIARALASLPRGQRAALILVEWLGLDDRTAGQALGIEPVSVRVRVSRAKAALREAFGAHDE
jgi:RNA polymerase sigma-70 factor (ECF subfamily)